MYVEDRTVAEVAGLMGVPEGTVKSRAHRARQLMRAALRRHGDARRRRTDDRRRELTAGPGRTPGPGPGTSIWTGCGSAWPRRSGGAARAGPSGWPGGCCARRAWPGRW